METNDSHCHFFSLENERLENEDIRDGGREVNTKVKKLGDVGDKFHNVNASDHPAPRTLENDSC